MRYLFEVSAQIFSSFNLRTYFFFISVTVITFELSELATEI